MSVLDALPISTFLVMIFLPNAIGWIVDWVFRDESRDERSHKETEEDGDA